MPAPRRPRAFNSTLARPERPMNKVNESRRARREEADLVYGTHHEWIGTLPCVLAGLQGHVCEWYDGIPTVGHHLKSVGSGGEDRRNQIPVCGKAHAEFHAEPLSTVCRRWHRDFRSIACELTEQFDRENQ